jgi:hypothetical protein
MWNVRGAFGNAAIILKRLGQHGERETSGAGFMGEQRPLVARESPVVGQFIGVPGLLHGGFPF